MGIVFVTAHAAAAQEAPTVPVSDSEFMPPWARKTWIQLLQARSTPGFKAVLDAAPAGEAKQKQEDLADEHPDAL
ncbi:MAG: hypothetical protein EOP85_03020, partial [Verrucomicrobiaceae bacterium]